MGAPDEHLAQQLAIEMNAAIQAVVKRMLKPNTLIGKAINVTDVLCDLDRGEGSPAMSGVRLNALDEATGTYCTVVPKEGSWVLVDIIEGDRNEGVVIATTEIEKVIWKCGANTTYLFTNGTIELKTGDKSIKITAAEILMNGGTNGGIPIIADLVNRINILEQDNNKLKEAFVSWTVSPQDGGAALRVAVVGVAPTGPAVPGSWAADMITVTEVSDIENPLVKH